MNTPRRYVLNLPDWELPRLDDLEWALVERLAEAAQKTRFHPELLKDSLHDILHCRITKLAESTVNEAIEYWLKGLGDGNNGRWPELCVALPFLERRETTEPLTLAYCVDNADDTRTELNRTTLEAVVSRLFEEADPPASVAGRAKIVAFALRQLAERLERLSAQSTR